MARPRLDADTQLDISISAIFARHRYIRDPAPVIAELVKVAGERTDILARVAGRLSGYYDSPDTHTLCAALAEIPGAADWVEEGRQARARTMHSAAGPRR